LMKSGAVIAPLVRSLPKNSIFTVKITINGRVFSLGTINSGGSGSASIPSISAAIPGNYLVTLVGPRGLKFYLKYLVKN
jgi:hypothetical protein